MEFKNREEMIEFEEKRINYYLESINAIDHGGFDNISSDIYF